MKITFLHRHIVQQGDGKGPVYEAGKTYDFDGFVAESYARKYVNRGLAVDYVEPPAAPTPEPLTAGESFKVEHPATTQPPASPAQQSSRKPHWKR